MSGFISVTPGLPFNSAALEETREHREASSAQPSGPGAGRCVGWRAGDGAESSSGGECARLYCYTWIQLNEQNVFLLRFFCYDVSRSKISQFID